MYRAVNAGATANVNRRPGSSALHGHSPDTITSRTSEDADLILEGSDPAPKRKHVGDADGTSTKPKQKRNKPTLSCLECVERKTKCDRGRPCLACVKRQSSCEYTAVANLIASTDRRNGANNSKARYVIKHPSKIRKVNAASSTDLPSPASDAKEWSGAENTVSPTTARFPSTIPPFQVTNLPYSQSSPSNVFGVGSQHPFANWWTIYGGLPEVISVLPSKDQADILIAKYFEAVDPVYPFIHRRTFYSDYEEFWALPIEEKGRADASLIALHYAMYALGTQFLSYDSFEEGSQTAEFYCSAANQALRVYSYLNRTSLRAIQAMLLMTYFLMNDNHASDAYAWAGIHLRYVCLRFARYTGLTVVVRQAYAMRLHRDPDIVVPDASVLEKQQRRKLWQAIFHHDTFLTILLKLPPTATHSDVPVESLADENELSHDGLDICLGTHSRVENLMSISVIAPQTRNPLPPPQPHHTLEPRVMKSDVAYIRSMWHLGNLVQENLSSACSLSLPIANSPRHKETLVAAFRRLYKSFPAHLTVQDTDILHHQTATQPRAVRQNLFLTSNYFHCLMLLHASDNLSAGVVPNVSASLEAAREALGAFFKLWRLFESEAGVWWVFQHRALEESLLIAELLRGIYSTSPAPNGPIGPDASLYAEAEADIARMLDIMKLFGDNQDMHRARKQVLQEAFNRIHMV